MADLLYVVLMVVLTGIGIAFVFGCDKIIGPDDQALADQTGTRTPAIVELEQPGGEWVA
jgi:hypothetical protein